MAHISLDCVTKIFPDRVVALDHMTLDIADGELMVILGPSGCGKTTTLRVIAGLERASAGDIRMDGESVSNVPAKDRNVAMVFQNYALYPHLTVFENMAFGLKCRGCPRTEIDRRVRDAANMLGIEGLLDRRPAALSGGQRQRVAVGRAFVQRPRVFLFDEPLSNLDPRLRLVARTELKRLLGQLQTTAVYVTHDQEEAMTLGDRIAVMSEGIVRQIGRPLELFNSPFDRFVAGFIGTPPMNFLDGTISVSDHGLVFTTPDGVIALPERLAGLIQGADQKRAILGIRPGDLRCKRGDAAHGRGLVGTAEAIETPPGRWDIHIKTPSQVGITGSLGSPPPFHVGDRVAVTPDPSEIKLFESDSYGRNMLYVR